MMCTLCKLVWKWKKWAHSDLLLGSVTFSKAPHYCPHLRPGPTDSNQGTEKGSLYIFYIFIMHVIFQHISMRVGKHTNIFVRRSEIWIRLIFGYGMIQYKHGGKTWAEVTLWIVCQDVTRFRWRTSAFVVHSLGKQRDEERDNKPPQLCECCRGVVVQHSSHKQEETFPPFSLTWGFTLIPATDFHSWNFYL